MRSPRTGPASDRYIAAGAVAGLVLLVVTWVAAAQRPLPASELDLFEKLNDTPDALSTVLWPIMQLGSVVGFLTIAAVAGIWARSVPVAVATLAGGLTAWIAAKVVKRIVGRERPLAYVETAIVRDGDGMGLGFTSGHTAVAFALATVLAPLLPLWGRVIVFGLACVVGVARMTHGVHMPLDVVGGAGLGLLCGAAVHLLWRAVDRLRSRDAMTA